MSINERREAPNHDLTQTLVKFEYKSITVTKKGKKSTEKGWFFIQDFNLRRKKGIPGEIKNLSLIKIIER